MEAASDATADAPSSSDPPLTHDEIRRYSRHLILDDVGVEGQRRLKASSVVVLGAGGLGSPALLYLAAAGVGTIGVVDDDVVDESNLQRQVVHATDAVGTPKVESARQRLAGINPHVKLQTHAVRLSAANALDVLAPYDVVVDGCDNFSTRYLVNDACVLLGKPLVYAAVQKFEGQLSLFNHPPGVGPTYRDLFPSPPPPGAVPSCAEAGVLGVLPGVLGTLQATEALKVLLGKGDTLSGRLLLYDALRMKFHEVKLKKRADAPPILALEDYAGFCGVAAAGGGGGGGGGKEHLDGPFERVSVARADAWRRDGWRPYTLDVRTAAEAAVASLPFADRLHPHRQVAQIAAEIPADRDVLVHCKTDIRSAAAARDLAAAGLTRLYVLEGGIDAWAREVDPSLPVY